MKPGSHEVTTADSRTADVPSDLSARGIADTVNKMVKVGKDLISLETHGCQEVSFAAEKYLVSERNPLLSSRKRPETELAAH